MDALLELVGVLAALHLLLGLHWFRRPVYAFRAWWGRRVAPIPGSRAWGSDRMALLVAPPLPWTGELFLAELGPLSLGPDAVLAFVAQEANPGGRTVQSARLVRWDDVRGVRAEGRRVLVAGRELVATSSGAHARHLAALLVRLAPLDPRAREREAAAALRRALDADAAHARVATFRALAPRLRANAALTFALLFVALPAAGATVGLAAAWPWLAAALVTLQAWSTLAFVRAHRALNPEARSERILQAVAVALSPPEALRAAELLSRDLLAAFHPLAAGAALLSEGPPDPLGFQQQGGRFEPFAAAILRDALHPLPPVCPSDDPLAVATERAARERLVGALAEAARRLGLPADVATRAPAADADERAYCPRCLRTYLLASGTCSECWELPLEPLPTR